jgi:hypothetical protein
MALFRGKLSRIRAGVELIQATLQRIEGAEDLLPQPIDACRCAALPVAMGAIGIERGRAAVDRHQPPGACRVIDRAQRAPAQLADLVERRGVGAAARAIEENAFQPHAAVARDLDLARCRTVSQRV